MTAFLFYNPNAGKHRFKNTQTVISTIISLAKQYGLEIEASSEIPTSFSSYSCVIGMGGDGTLNRLIQSLPSTIPLGIIPFGSANVLAKHLDIPFRLREAIACIAKGKTRTIDLGILGNKKFVCMAGFGFDAEVIFYADGWLKKMVGRTSYVLAAVRVLLTHSLRTHNLTLSTGSDTYTGHFAIIANCPLYGGKFVLSQSCLDNDGMLDVFLLTKPSKWALIKGFIKLGTTGLTAEKHFQQIKVNHAQLASLKPNYHIDAELLTEPPQSVPLTVLSKGLTVIVP